MSVHKFSPGEMMAVAAARELREGENALIGIGLPEVAARLAKRTHAPNLRLLLEVGVIGPDPVEPTVGIADPRLWYRASRLGSYLDVLGMILHRGLIDVGFLGALEVDQYGNINSSLTEENGRRRYFFGSGGGNDIASLARRVVITMRHERRKFPPKVTYITSPGHLEGNGSRQRAGLRGGGPVRVITDKAVMGFDPVAGRMICESIHPGVSPQELVDATGFPIAVSADTPVTPFPDPEQLRLIRDEIDPEGLYTR